jgi:O-methyltransferase involved in polyketide biosynthesis
MSSPTRAHPETISPTAHYTGYVWFAHGHSHEAFATPTGRLMYHALRGPNLVAQRVRLPTLEGMLLARHRLIDLRLALAIETGAISQVIEVAAGLSPRGWRFANRYRDRITYVEADLPGMIAHKRRILANRGGESAHHRTVELDALVDDGPTSIAAIGKTLDPERGTAIITEGLVNYFDAPILRGMWKRFATALREFPASLYLSDLILKQGNDGPFVTGFSWLLSAFVRGKTHLHFDGVDDAERALAECGMPGVLLDPREFADEMLGIEPEGAARVRIIEAQAGV